MSELILILIILFLPLLSGLVGFISKYSSIISIVGVSFSFLFSLVLAFDRKVIRFEWLWVEGVVFSIHIDRISSVLIVLVNLISLLVLIYSSRYMEEDNGDKRYFAFLGFFIFSMLGLLMTNHLLLLFVFWELVGLASYLLIGFWYQKESVPASARTSFMINRIADTSLLAGIILLFRDDFDLTIGSEPILWTILPSILIAVGAFGKSAQLPFSGWLLKAMAGPTPVSALIHAATMVAAGVYLLVRVSPFLPQEVLNFIAIIGCLTSCYAAICAIVRHDIKKVLAFSTISQLGYMVLGIGVGAADASLFHLITHAFFKAGLFLGAASVINFMCNARKNDSRDMRYMGGLTSKLPWTCRSFILCSLALAGLPLFSGFLSKDSILLGAWLFATKTGSWAYIISDLAIFTTLLTAFYVARMVLLVFFGTPRTNLTNYKYRESKRLYFPLVILGVFSLFIFFNLNPLGHSSYLIEYMGFPIQHLEGSIIPFLSILMVISGFVLAFSWFKPGAKYTTTYLKNSQPKSGLGIFALEGFQLGELYRRVGIAIYKLSLAAAYLDRQVIDPMLHFVSIGSVVGSKVLALIERFMVNGPVNLSASILAFLGKRFAGLSARDGQTQIIWLLVMVILILGWFIFF
ncbi:MAG: NADH-quinone oxidoreductase subunit L [Ekhidna sp.]|nr:NADH-quinone oxidoreductase subunit L [Ekhidna sp.]